MDWLSIIFLFFFLQFDCAPVSKSKFPLFTLAVYFFFCALSYSSQGVQVLNLSVEMTFEKYNFEHLLLEMHFFYVNITKRRGGTVHAAVRLLHGRPNITRVVAVRTWLQ